MIRKILILTAVILSAGCSQTVSVRADATAAGAHVHPTPPAAATVTVEYKATF